MFKSRKFVKIFLLLVLPAIVKAQSSQETRANLPQVILPSPNAASLGVYGQVPVSLFNGLPQISIPIGNLLLDNIKVDISLNYHGGGIQPDLHPTWVGLGWDLNAGGVITRKINGGVDEGLALEDDPPTKHIYYDNPTVANNDQWYSQSNMENYAEMITPIQDRVLPSPDEFTFNFGGYAGSFYYDQTGQWQVKSESPLKLKVLEILINNFSLPPQAGGDPVSIPRSFYEFDITTPDGAQYIFGGTPNSVEFSRPANGNQPSPSPSNYAIYASAWYLTKIITPNKRIINLTYERDNIIVPIYSSYLNYRYEISSGGFMGSGGDGNHITIINPCYLTSINAPNQEFRFPRLVSNELAFDYGIDNSVIEDMENIGQVYSDLTVPGHPLLASNVKWYKLDRIEEYTGTGNLLKKMVFGYREDVSTRLMLNQIQEFSPDGIAKPPFIFSYNEEKTLPSYNSKKIDHWGYFNGVNFFENYPVTTVFDDSYVPAYTNSRSPQDDFVQAGMLIAIKYPTGGKTKFEYQANDYQKVVNVQKPQSTIASVAKQTGAGVRIYKINNYDAFDNLLTSKEYLYLLNYNQGGTMSSGILGGTPSYLESANQPFPGTTATLNYWYWYSTPIEPLGYTQGRAVTYSEVVEKQLDGSYTIYKYSNHDHPQYMDQPSLAIFAPNANQWKLDPVISFSLDRGKLLEKSIYKSNNTQLKDIKFEYDESTSRYQEAVRIINVFFRIYGNQNPEEPAIISSRATAYLIYTFPRYLIKQTDITYDMNGQNPLTVVTNFTYDNNRNIKEKSVENTGSNKTFITTYNYPYDYPPTTPPLGLSAILLTERSMVDRHILSTPSEIINYVEQDGVRKVVGATMNTFLKNSNSDIVVPFQSFALKINSPVSDFVPAKIVLRSDVYNSVMYYYEEWERDNRYYNKVNYDNFDITGNLLQYHLQGDEVHTYLWDYNNTYPVAEIKNAGQSDIAYTSFEADGKGNWDFNGSVGNTGGAITGNNYYSSASPITKPGLTITKKYIVSYWQKGGSVSITGGTQSNALTGKTVDGWTYKEVTVTNTNNVSISISGGYIDELRLYPSDAQITTYTYKPQSGMTSQCDENNKITYYEYDGFGRLNLIRDQNKNILKKICYNYQGQSGNCSFQIYTNDIQSQSFTRNNCTGGMIGSTVTYTVAAGTYQSTISKADANDKALNDINLNGQTYANENGTCTAPTIYARIELFNIYNDIDYTTADVYIKFYSNSTCTIPYSVSNLNVNYQSVRHTCEGFDYTNNYTQNSTGTQVYLGNKIIDRDDGVHCEWTTYSVTPGTGYTAK